MRLLGPLRHITAPRHSLPCPPPGVSYGLTQQLYSFWRKAGYEPLYLRQSASETTGVSCAHAMCHVPACAPGCTRPRWRRFCRLPWNVNPDLMPGNGGPLPNGINCACTT